MSEEKQKTEFIWFEELQNNLVTVFKSEGFDQVEAEELGFCVAQGVRNVPSLLKMLSKLEQYTSDEVMDAVHDVLANIHALQEANDLLLGRKSFGTFE